MLQPSSKLSPWPSKRRWRDLETSCHFSLLVISEMEQHIVKLLDSPASCTFRQLPNAHESC